MGREKEERIRKILDDPNLKEKPGEAARQIAEVLGPPQAYEPRGFEGCGPGYDSRVCTSGSGRNRLYRLPRRTRPAQ